jgi:hypothetical protein
MQVSLEQLVTDPCLHLIRVGRLAVVGPNPPELEALLSPSEEEPPAAPETKPAPPPPEHSEKGEKGLADTAKVLSDGDPVGGDPQPKAEEPVGAGEAEGSSDGGEDSSGGGETINALEDTSKVWTEAELFDLNTADQKTILRSRGLKLSGKEADRVARILDAQEGS